MKIEIRFASSSVSVDGMHREVPNFLQRFPNIHVAEWDSITGAGEIEFRDLHLGHVNEKFIDTSMFLSVIALWESLAPPPPAPPTPQEQLVRIEAAIERHMDAVAQAKRYDNRDSCRLYAGYANPFQVEAIAYGQWVAQCWVVSNQAQTDIINGLRTIPTEADAVAELPLMIWPV